MKICPPSYLEFHGSATVSVNMSCRKVIFIVEIFSPSKLKDLSNRKFERDFDDVSAKLSDVVVVTVLARGILGLLSSLCMFMLPLARGYDAYA